MLESVVWQNPLPQRHLIVGQIIEHILRRHEPRLLEIRTGLDPSIHGGSNSSPHLKVAAGQLQQLLLVNQATKGSSGKSQHKQVLEMEEATPLLLQSFQELEKMLQSLTGDKVSI